MLKSGNFKRKRMGKNTIILPEEKFESFIDGNSSTGRFRNAAEIIPTGLRLSKDEENQIKVLRNAIQDGVNSGIVKDFNPKNHLKMMKDIKKTNV